MVADNLGTARSRMIMIWTNLAHITSAHDAQERKEKNGQQRGHLSNKKMQKLQPQKMQEMQKSTVNDMTTGRARRI